ncbi:MAG TPA: helix-turn-helix transcriptional regulator [Jiangellaceae bacterium]
MKDDTPAGLRAVAHAVRTLRTVHGLTQDQLGKKIGYSRSQVNDVEHARVWPHADFVTGCDRAFGTGTLLVGLHGQGRDQGLPSWAAALVEAEEQAVTIRSWQPVTISGLVQTRDYASVILDAGQFGESAGDELERMIARRLDRQKIFGAGRLRSYHLIMGEAALHQIVGTIDVMTEQLTHLFGLMRTRVITVQILNYDASAYGPPGPMTIFDLEDKNRVVHLTGPLNGETTSDPSMISEAVKRFDLMRSEAASLRESARMIESRIEELKT